MKADHGLCTALRHKLQEIPQLNFVKVHLFEAPQRQYPLIILQLTHLQNCSVTKHKRIVLKAEIAAQDLQQHLLPFYAQLMVTAFENISWRLEEPYHATLRSREYEFTANDKHGICTARQSFDAFVHP